MRRRSASSTWDTRRPSGSGCWCSRSWWLTCSCGSSRAGGLRDDDFFFRPRFGQTGNTLRYPLPRAALDTGADSVDGSCVVQAGGRPTLFDTGLYLQADHATLRGALYRWRPRVLLSEQCARGRIIDCYSSVTRLPRRLRARQESLPRQAACGVLDHLDAHGPDSSDRPSALHPLSVRKLARLDTRPRRSLSDVQPAFCDLDHERLL